MNDNDVQYQNLSNEVTDENRYVKNIQNQVNQNSSPYQTNENMQPNNDSQGYIHPYVAPNEEFAQDLNQLKSKGKSKHCQAFIATFFLLAGIITGVIIYSDANNGLPLEGLIGICGGSYVLYLIIGFCCNPLLSYLGNISRGELFETCYDQIRAMIGRFCFHA